MIFFLKIELTTCNLNDNLVTRLNNGHDSKSMPVRTKYTDRIINYRSKHFVSKFRMFAENQKISELELPVF